MNNFKKPSSFSESRGVSRRDLMAGTFTAGVGLLAFGVPKVALASRQHQPQADTGQDYPQPRPNARTDREYRLRLIGPATVSLMACEIAVTKASNDLVLEFANFELREQQGMAKILEEMHTPKPEIDAHGKRMLDTLRNTPRGAEFDRAFITGQLHAHQYLRDLGDSFVKNSAGATSAKERHGRHIAMATLPAIREHLVHCRHILDVVL